MDMAYRTTSEAISELRRPWPSLVGKIPALTDELEREFRFGQRVTYFNNAYRKGGNIKGGSSSIWYPAEVEEFDAYEAWREQDGIPSEEDRASFDELQGLLDRAGTELRGGGPRDETTYQPRYGKIYRLALEILTALPFEHLSGMEISILQLGGWGPDSAKASAYLNGTVMIYDFALKGARRTFVGLFLHELGHAHERRLGAEARKKMRDVFVVLSREDALIGVEYLLDGESRKSYQRTSLTEFMAETHMIYVTHGAKLREEFNGAGGEVASAWETIYDVFRDSFGGVEYA